MCWGAFALNKPAGPKHFDLGSPDFVADPYPVYRDLREHSPVYRHPLGFWFISRYNDVRAALNENRLSNRPAPLARVSRRNIGRFAAADVANRLMAFEDASDHQRVRRPLVRAMLETRAKNPIDLNDLAEGCLSDVRRGEPFDVVSDFAIPFSARTACRLFGLPEVERSQLERYSFDFFHLFHAISDALTFERLNRSLSEFRARMSAHFADAKDRRDDDLVSQVAEQARSAGISDDEVIDNLMLLFADAIGNVQAGIANCVAVLLREGPAAADHVHDRTSIGRVIEECLRLEAPGQHQARISTEDIDFNGQTIRKNSVVLLSFASANRDERAFVEPDHFDATRSDSQPLTFGDGPHRCLGAALVKAELAAALTALFSERWRVRFGDNRPTWLPRAGHRWLASLPVVVEG